jgi:hypothetical protein
MLKVIFDSKKGNAIVLAQRSQHSCQHWGIWSLFAKNCTGLTISSCLYHISKTNHQVTPGKIQIFSIIK